MRYFGIITAIFTAIIGSLYVYKRLVYVINKRKIIFFLSGQQQLKSILMIQLLSEIDPKLAKFQMPMDWKIIGLFHRMKMKGQSAVPKVSQ